MDDIVCEKCGNENPTYATFCSECGSKLNSGNESIQYEEKKIKSPYFSTENLTIRLIGFIIGIIIIFLARSFIHQIYVLFLLFLLGGLIASFLAANKYRDGFIIGLLVGLIGAALALFYQGIYSTFGSDVSGLTAFTLGYSVIPMILSIIGSLIAVFVKKRYFNLVKD